MLPVWAVLCHQLITPQPFPPSSQYPVPLPFQTHDHLLTVALIKLLYVRYSALPPLSPLRKSSLTPVTRLFGALLVSFIS